MDHADRAEESKKLRAAIGLRLRSARAALGHTAVAVAKRAGDMSPHLLWKYESGRVTPGIESVRDLAKALGVSMEWLVSGEGEGPPLIADDEERAQPTGTEG